MHGFSTMSGAAISASARHDPQSTLIAATRDDGLGGRLLAIVNAKCLANKLGCRFGFTWDRQGVEDTAFHIAGSVEKIFSADFIDKYLLGDDVDIAAFGDLVRTRFTRSSLQRATRQRGIAGWTCNDFLILESFRDRWLRRWLPGNTPARWRSETFWTLGFSDPVRAAFAAAEKCRFPRPMVALHLRSGDIVRGRFRSTLDFGDKVIPSTLAKAIVSKLSSKGFATLLVGQDSDTLRYLKSRTGAFLAEDFGAGEFEDETIRAFFEIAVMARCRRIYAGNSIFAQIASIMGGVPSLKARALFRKRQAAAVILEELKHHEADYHPLEAAFGYRSALFNLKNTISSASAREILGKAYALDPESDIYALKTVVTYFRKKDYAPGEAILKSLMTKQFQASSGGPLAMMQALTAKARRNHGMANDYKFFFAAAKAGYPHAAICSAYIFHEALGEKEPALKMAAISLKAEPANEIFKDVNRRISS